MLASCRADVQRWKSSHKQHSTAQRSAVQQDAAHLTQNRRAQHNLEQLSTLFWAASSAVQHRSAALWAVQPGPPSRGWCAAVQCSAKIINTVLLSSAWYSTALRTSVSHLSSSAAWWVSQRQCSAQEAERSVVLPCIESTAHHGPAHLATCSSATH